MEQRIDVSLGRWMAERSARAPRRRAISFEGSTRTYGDLQERIDRLAAALRAGGVRHGDRVGYLGMNHPAFLETMFAASRLGAIFVPLNFRLTGPEITFICEDAGLHTLVADAAHQQLADSVRSDLSVRRLVSSEAARPGWESLDELVGAHDPIEAADEVDADEVAVIMYTSGTTGRPKGAMLTHANLWWNNVNGMLTLDVMEDDVTLVAAPLFHIGGLNVTTLITLQKGGEVVLQRSFDPGACLEAIPHHGVTTMFGVPAMFLFMSQHPGFADADLTSLRMLVCGGAPVPEPLIKLYNSRGVPIQQGYGLTETSPMVSFLTSEWALAKVGSAGRPPILTEVRLVDASGAPVSGAGERGEVCVRGPNVMKGYWNQQAATAEAIDEAGWFHTGDVGYIDEDGFLYLVDRLKDMIITGGENVYPAEVESVLYDHPAIAEVAVIGMPDERWGESVAAVAVLAKGADLTLDELREFAKPNLAAYKLPTRLELVAALPRNPAGKILKTELRERFGG
ncbi:MAG: acyl-CoA synthetase [Acidimicrobiales bacterium]|nr:long-chain fatty acid--CoA ligase [Actinomycetota bacterium]